MKTPEREIELTLDLGTANTDFIDYCSKVRRVISASNNDAGHSLFSKLRRELRPAEKRTYSTSELKLLLAKSIILDLLSLGWLLKIRKSTVVLFAPIMQNMTVDQMKKSVRKGHLIERDSQLNQGSVREFVKRMEGRRLTSKGWHSIFSVMRDGKDLANKLAKIAGLDDEKKKLDALSNTIKPYLHFIDEEKICKYTGLELGDVWRYFRHTWVNAYKSLPGRSMMILIRDAAAENHPIIGIAALGSPIVQQKLRDAWIGWDEDSILKKITSCPSGTYSKWLLKCLEEQIAAIYVDDLYREKLCSPLDMDYPTDIAIKKLNQEELRSIDQHRAYPNAASMKIKQGNSDDALWKQQAETKLFKSKRCGTLASLISIRQEFQKAGLRTGKKKELEAAIKSNYFIGAIRRLVRMVRAEHVGINMMDIIVCGAVAPYNTLLGGKLVCMLLCSPEVVQMYSKKYGEAVSIIASSMKGKAVIRKPSLVLLTTTSLYGKNSSQYNRIKMPCSDIGGIEGEYIEYKEIGKSEGYGTYHFSDITLDLIEILLARSGDGRRVNSIFGEGVNPRMRKIRDGLGLLGLSPDELLIHGNPRIVYAVKLARNFHNILLGVDKTPKYYLPTSQARNWSDKIVSYWYRRWLLNRIARIEIIDEVGKHQLSYPIEHGARVLLPAAEEESGNLFAYKHRDK